jgi:SAM-dependent methyltransferase
MRNYTPEAYDRLVTHMEDAKLQQFMKDEINFIAGVPDARERTFVDLGAGNGRVEPYLSEIAGDVVAVEINTEMFKGLALASADLPNVRVVYGDFLKLPGILPEFIHRPMFLILQNSLGTIEGDANQALAVIKQEATKRNGGLILSLLRQPALRGWGVQMYSKLAPMVGNVDMQKSNFETGLLVTDTGYTSKWWTDADIAQLQSLGQVTRQAAAAEYAFLELSFAKTT